MSETDIRLGIAGAAGRMGRMLVSGAASTDGVTCAAGVEHGGSDALGMDAGTLAGIGANGVSIGTDLSASLDDFDVLIEFTLPEATLEHLAVCADAGKAVVIGTTGFSAEQRAAIGAAAQKIPVVFAPNMSVGVNVCLSS